MGLGDEAREVAKKKVESWNYDKPLRETDECLKNAHEKLLLINRLAPSSLNPFKKINLLLTTGSAALENEDTRKYTKDIINLGKREMDAMTLKFLEIDKLHPCHSVHTQALYDKAKEEAR